MGDVWRLVRCGEDSRVIVLDRDNVVIGRNVELKYRIDAGNISRQHACFRSSSDGTLEVTDLRSHNGVFVNGEKITPAMPVPLREGDVIGFGKPAPCAEDVFVFTLKKNSAAVAPSNGLPDVSSSAILLSDDDDDVMVTEVVPANRRLAASARSASREESPDSSTSLPLAEDACPPVKVKKEDVDSDSESGSHLGSSPASAGQVFPSACTGISKTDRAGVLHVNSTLLRQQIPETGLAVPALGTEQGERLRIKVETEKNAWESSVSSSTSTVHKTANILGSSANAIREPATERNLEHQPVSDTHRGLSAFVRLPEIKRQESAHTAQKGGVSGDAPAYVRTHIKEDAPACIPASIREDPEKVDVRGAAAGHVPKNIKEDPENPISSEMSRLRIHHNQGEVSCDIPAQSGFNRRLESPACATAAVEKDEVHAHVYSMPLDKAGGDIGKHDIVYPQNCNAMAAANRESEAAASLQTKSVPKKCATNVPVKKEPVFTDSSASSSHSDLNCIVKESEEGPLQSAGAPEMCSTSVYVKKELVLCDSNSKMFHNPFVSDMPKKVSSVAFAKNVQDSFSAGSPSRKVDSDAKQCTASKETDLSSKVKHCSVVVQRLESVLTKLPLSDFVSNQESSSKDDEADQDDIEQNEVESAQENRGALHNDGSQEVQFSQNDVIIILSDSEDEDSKLIDFKIKEEPEVEESIGNDVEDTMPWVSRCLDDLPGEGNVEPAPSLGEDKELEKRLVWNDPEPEETTSADQGQPEDDFFPELSQNFYDEPPVPAKKMKTSSTVVAGRSSSLSSSVRCQPNYADRLPGSPKKKGSLRDKLMKTMKHRVPMAGGGSAVQKKRGEMLQKPSSGVGGEESSKKSHYKERFQSRTVHLLNTQESLDAATSALKKRHSRSVRPLNTVQALSVKARSSDGSSETARQSSPSLEVQATVPVLANSSKGETSPQEEPCFAVPAFKQALRISRVAKRPPVDAAVAHAEDEVPPAPPLVPSPVDQLPEPMDIELTERKTRVRFHIEHTSNKTDEQRAEFAARVRASLKRKRLDKIQKCKANLDVFILNILNWKVQWLKEQLESLVLPPLVDMQKFRRKRTMYSNLEEYKMISYYFLCVEIWQHIFHDWRDFFSRTSRMIYNSAVVRHVCPPGELMILTCVVVATPQQMQKFLYPIEGHLVRLDLRIQDKRSAAMPVFGFVMEHKFLKDPRTHKTALPKLLENVYTDGCTPITLKIQVKARPVTLDFGKVQRLSVVSKISPILRQMEAVSLLEKSAFAQCIARPNVSNFWCGKGSPMKSGFRNTFSDEQHEVISSAVAAVNTAGTEARTVLLHGPPGTGKTHTIVGIVTELLCRNSKQTVLLVAPSNAAVDEIGRRLLFHRQWQYRLKVPPEQILKVVRIGQDRMVHSEVRGICLDELLQKNIQKEENERINELQQTINFLELEMKKCAQKKTELMRHSDTDNKILRRLEFETNHLKAQLLQTREKKKIIETTGRLGRSINERKLAILRGAHVVLSTLNSCRSRLMEEAFGHSSGYSFSCVIVDEATQCTEVEALLCLQYPTSRLILVGDPMQLPATVLSQDAVDRGFQESLFERFYNYLQLEADSNPVFILTEQRRMHSEICLFPSSNFYSGKLRPIAGLDAKYASFSLTPYLVFNISDSPETNEASSTSWLNHGEAAFVARLCLAISMLAGPDVSLGVITPYQAQKTAIVEQLQDILPRLAATVNVNTVDGFQGQERDVIVFSCVRAHNPRGCIGFVADARRLNVAITRAKKALFICGHLDSLKDTEEWRALISDAQERCKVKDISASCSSTDLSDIIRKPYSTVQ
ncbi:uncharacterized protein LOC144128305 [Amblyomma americanum]